MKYFRKEPGERVIQVKSIHLTELQVDGCCDTCNRDLKAGVRVVGKVVEIRKGTLLGARFSPTCLVCMDLN